MKLSLSDVLMFSGVLAIAFYVLHIVIGGIKWKGYSHLQQPISDLTASGAPNRNLMLTLTTIYGLLALLFVVSFTVLKSSEHHSLVFWGGISFIVLHLVSLLYPHAYLYYRAYCSVYHTYSFFDRFWFYFRTAMAYIRGVFHYYRSPDFGFWRNNSSFLC